MSLFDILTNAKIEADLSITTDLSLLPSVVVLARLATLHRLQREAPNRDIHRPQILEHLQELIERQGQ